MTLLMHHGRPTGMAIAEPCMEPTFPGPQFLPQGYLFKTNTDTPWRETVVYPFLPVSDPAQPSGKTPRPKHRFLMRMPGSTQRRFLRLKAEHLRVCTEDDPGWWQMARPDQPHSPAQSRPDRRPDSALRFPSELLLLVLLMMPVHEARVLFCSASMPQRLERQVTLE